MWKSPSLVFEITKKKTVVSSCSALHLLHMKLFGGGLPTLLFAFEIKRYEEKYMERCLLHPSGKKYLKCVRDLQRGLEAVGKC